MIILALDALDKRMVEKFNCTNLMQEEFGETDISQFTLEKTVIIWASFLAGKNMEKKIEPPVYLNFEKNLLKLANKIIPSNSKFHSLSPFRHENFLIKLYRKFRWYLIGSRVWNFRLSARQTFLKFFNSFKVIDLPAFSFKEKNHRLERILLARFFENESFLNRYEEIVWKNHEENKKDFLNSIGKYDLLIGYFNLADAIGHLSFGIEYKMRKVYYELNDIAKRVQKEAKDDVLLIVSDHGMKAVGRFGDHTKHGFYSINRKLNLKTPKITDFYEIIRNLHKMSSS